MTRTPASRSHLAKRKATVPSVKVEPSALRTLFVIRTAIVDATALSTYAAFEAAFPGDVLLCTAEGQVASSLAARDLPGFTVSDPDALGLYAHPAFAHRCADYHLYRARKERPGYGQYWLVQSDVFINALSLHTFFAASLQDDADLLALELGARPDDWGWAAAMLPAGLPVQGCRFAMLRASGRAVDHMREMRLKQAKSPAFATHKAWPKDEAFAPTILAAGGFVCRDINAAGRIHYTQQSLGAGLLANPDSIGAAVPDGLIYHPVRSRGAWLEQIETTTGALRRYGQPGPRLTGLRTRADASWLSNTGRALLAFPQHSETAFVPLMLAEELWRSSPWDAAPTEPHSSLYAQRREMCSTAFERRFGPRKNTAPLATVHHASCELPRDDLGIVQPADFVLGPGMPVGRIPRSVALPYSYDMQAREMLATLHVSLTGVLDDAFLYAAQRDRTRVVARIPIANLPKLYGPIDRSASPVLIFSLGRTGSTLLQKLIACATARSISEPDLLTQLAQSRAALLALSPQERAALIYYAVAPFNVVHIADDAGGRCVIKLRSQVNAIADQIADTLPAAKYVFMVRERRAWARSTYRAYNSKPEAVANRLVTWLQDLERLQQRKVDLQIVTYENVVADPHSAVRQLTGADPQTDPGLHRRIAKIAGVDSQAKHRLSRDNASGSRESEAVWMERFEEIWAVRRPAALIGRLTLAF